MNLIQAFSQSPTVLAINSKNPAVKSTGVCFRVSFEWVSSRARGTPWLADVMETHERHQDYKAEPNNYLIGQYNAWVQVAHACDEKFIDAWGKPHGIMCVAEKQDTSAYLATRLSGGLGAAFVSCFYGQKVDGSKWGHAVAFWSDGKNPNFFDANTGVWSFNNGEEPGPAIDAYVSQKYVTGGRSINDQWVYEILI
jgi:hypothetical protein